MLSMDTTEALVWTMIAIALAPLIIDILPINRLPVLVAEIFLGMLFGPHLLNLISFPENLDAFKEFGVIFLFFLAGFEIDINGIKNGPLRRALAGWAGSIVLALLIAFGMQQAGLISDFYLVAIAFTTTALGPLMPMLADNNLLGTSFGNNVISIGAVGEFGPVLAAAFLLNQNRSGFATASAILVFLAICIIGLRHLRRMVNAGLDNRILRVAVSTFDSSSQFAVRFMLVILVGLVYLADRFDLDVLLGAFAAGFILGQTSEVAASYDSHEIMESLLQKLESIGFGLFIPAFFVLTGAGLDLSQMTSSTRAWIILPLAVVGSLVIRGLPALAVYGHESASTRRRLALMSATQLPLVATLMATYIERGYVPVDVATAIILGAVVTVAIFPMLATRGLEEAANYQRGARVSCGQFRATEGGR